MSKQPAVSPYIQFLGAAGTVTGSRYLLVHQDVKLMIDCGLFQGLKSLRLRNWEKLPIDAAEVDAVVLTHAHLDHCGYLPRLVREGFRGKIFSTKYTRELAEVILRDSARIQTEDAKYAVKKGFSHHEQPVGLYEEADVEQTLPLFQDQPFEQRVQVARETFVTFHPAGHILGAAFVEVEFFGKRLLFTGDMGRDGHPLLGDPDPKPSGHFDALITESTYGDREHETTTTEFQDTINATLARGGSVLIPAFAVDRTEIILVKLRELIESGKIPPVPVYADSPMALRALAFYRQAIDEHSPEIRESVATEWAGRDPFDPGTLVELSTVDQSKTVNDPKQPCIIISASGMGTGGRVVHHLADMLPNPKHTVILVGYQAIGTRGRTLSDGADFVKMHGEFVPVKAQIAKIMSFSVHADAEELLGWLANKPGDSVDQVLVVHGEEGASEALRDRIKGQLGLHALVPQDGQKIAL
jgi:metallo-beta-lactamase family protein